VCRGLTSSSTSESGDFPTIAEPFTNEVEEDYTLISTIPRIMSAKLTRRDCEALEGARCWFPIPCNEFIEAFFCRVGVEDRVSWLMELGLLCKGLRGGNLPFGDEVLSMLLYCPSVRAGEEGCEDEGKAVAEAALSERF